MTNNLESRRSFRISEPTYLKYEVLTDREFADGLERRKIRLGIDNGAQSELIDVEARLSQAMYQMGAENVAVGKVLTVLNDKINIVVNQMPGLRATKASLINSKPQICDVAADGLVFSSREQLAPGTKLYVEFLLESDNRYVETFAKVLRNTDPPDPTHVDLPFGTAVEFHGMKSEQREILIQHMFNRESETLRMRRLKLDDKGLV